MRDGLLRLVLRTHDWFAVVTAGLAGNAVDEHLARRRRGRCGRAVSNARGVGYRFRAGWCGLAVSSIIGIAGLFSLPIFALPVIAGGAVSSGLVHAAELGVWASF